MQEQYSIREQFPGLEEELYIEMEQWGDTRTFEAGSILLKKGQTIRSTMLILDGIVKLYQEDDKGSEFFMYYIQPGEACAVSMLCAYRQESSQVLARAMTTVTVLMIPLERMDEWMGKYKGWQYFMIRTWRAKYDELLQTVNAIAFNNMDERLESYIVRQVEKLGRHVQLTHQDIATDLNSSREVISRLMKKMEKNGWVIQYRHSFEWKKDAL